MVEERGKIRTFMDLNAWKIGHDFVIDIYKVTHKFPAHEKFALADQLRRASVSITSNIAEGFPKRSKKEKIRFYSIANASLNEVRSQLVLSRDLQYISQNQYADLEGKSVQVGKLISGLIKSAFSYTIY